MIRMMERGIAIFIDESGSTLLDDRTTDRRYYVSAAIIVEASQIDTLNSMVDTISNRFNNGQALKSSKIGYNIDRRLRLLEELKEVPFQYIAIVIDKQSIDEKSGLRYKQVFYKNINGLLYSQVARSSSWKVHAYVDSYGAEVYQSSAFDYFTSRSDFFSGVEFHREADERKRLVQVADIISGSLRIWFVRGLNIDEKHKRLRALLREKEISLKCWPVLYSVPESIPVDSTNDEMDNRICETMLTTAANLIARYESSDKIEELRRCEVLKRLIEAKIEGRTVYCDYLIEMVNRGGSRPIGRKAFLSEVIGGLRREGIVITGTNKGYSLATTMSDIRAYLHQDRTVILPMLSKLECARKTLRVNSQIDILLGEENKELKACVDAMSNLHLSQFANQQEIDDENVIPTE